MTSVALGSEAVKRTEDGSSTSILPTKEGLSAEGQEENLEGLEKQETFVSSHSPQAFPDGGMQAWACTFGGFCCLFCSFGWVNCIGIFQDYYTQHQLKDYSPSTVSWISSLMTFCMFGGSIIVGKHFDSHGPRMILLVGTFMHVFGLMMTSISYKYWHFILAQGICSAAGASMIFYPAIGCVSTWFFKRRAFALGITASGSSLGGVIFPIMIRRLIVSVGFGWALRSAAFLILLMMTLANLTLRSRLPPRNSTPWTPGEFTRHFKELPFSLVTIGSFLFFFGMFLPFNYLPVFAQHHGMSEDLSNSLISILNAASVFGRILPGYLGDRLGRFNTMVIITYISTILIFALWVPVVAAAPVIVFAALYGFSTGAFVSLAPALVAQISDIKEIGVRSGALFGVVSFAALAGNPIGGALLSLYGGDYLGLQIFAGVMLFGGSTAFLIARWRLVGLELTKRV